MKTYFIFLCQIVSIGLANATIQNKANPDKPSAIYINQYSDRWAYSSGNGISWGASKYYTQSTNGFEQANGTSFYHFVEVGSGEGWWDLEYSWSDTNQSGYYMMTGGIATIGSESGTLYDCPYAFDAYSVPSVAWDANSNETFSQYYANVNYSLMYYGSTLNGEYNRNAKTFMTLKTGGRSGISRQNLFIINANATEYGRAGDYGVQDGPEVWSGTPTTSIDPTRIRVLGKNVGNDGNLFTVLPDNATLDLAASAPGRHYGLNISAQKCKLNIVANGNPLSADHVRSGAYFCVGQKVNFQAVFSPDISASLNYASPIWNYTADYINNHYVDINGCEEYNIAAIPALSNPTVAWFYNQQTQDATANLGLACKFNNGQSVYLFRQGKFNVFTPSIQFYPQSGSNAVVGVRHDAANGNPNVTYLGIGDHNQNNAMRFSAVIKSIHKFPGQAIATQLINRQEYLYALFGNIPIGTGGTNDLDGSEIYLNSQTSLTNIPGQPTFNPYAQVDFFDAPGIGLSYASPTAYLVASWTAWASCNDHFNTYFRFKPDGDSDNIYVTLGRVDWDWQGKAQYIGGFPSDPYPLTNWQVSGTGHDGPAFYPVNDFPIWPAVY